MDRSALVRATTACLVAGGAAFLIAGPLDPPTGPITPTYKTLTEVEPRIAINATNTPGDADHQYRISQPGSYYLTDNITGVSGKTCISIASSRVTLDLNGFALNGVSGSVDGVRANGNHGIAIRNGSVLDFATGIDAQETNGSRLDNLCATSNNFGFKIGLTAVVTDCTSVDNAIAGFTVVSTASLTRCSSQGGSRGFDIGQGSTLTDCNASGALTGFRIDGESTLERCNASANQDDGFHIQDSCVLSGCIASQNGARGFRVTARSRLANCVSRANDGYGFVFTEGNTLVECTAAGNGVDGVFIGGNANTVERSTIHENVGHGVYLFDGVGNTIDGNLLTYNGNTGLRVVTSDNLATRNRARGNGINYAFAAGADYGVVLSNPGAGFTSSAAWANFAY